MSGYFEKEHKRLISAFEGGWSDHPSDRGGRTIYGISKIQNPSWAGWELVEVVLVKCAAQNLPKAATRAALEADERIKELARLFYRQHYWDLVLGDSLAAVSQDVAGEVFEQSVNLGVYRACKNLQVVLNIMNRDYLIVPDIREDGKIGVETVSRLQRYAVTNDIPNVLKLLNHQQSRTYIDMASSDKTQRMFIRGWLTRT